MIDANPIKRDARQARRRRVVGPGARCACGETDPRCLTTSGDLVRCYACRSRAAGRPATEQHHPAGRHNLAATVPIPNNEHRILNDLQQEWPVMTLRNPTGSPLLQAAAAIRGWLDVLILIIERTIGWISPFLEALDAWLVEQLGDAWPGVFLTDAAHLIPRQMGGAR